jgi:glycosyltransferase involved in cell wall biosynthesis
VTLCKEGMDLLIEMFRIPDRQVGWLPFAFVKGAFSAFRSGCQVVYSSGSPWTAHLVGMLISLVLGRPLIVDFRDPWIQNPYRNIKHPLVEKIETLLERKIISVASYVVVNTKRACNEFASFYSCENKQKFVWISNGFFDDDFKILLTENNKSQDNKLKISHVGSLYGPRSPISLFKAIVNLKRKGIIHSTNFNLKFVGKFDSAICDIARSTEFDIDDLVTFVPPVDHGKALEEIFISDIQLIIQPNTSLQIPGKLFECIAAKKMVLALTHDGATADLVHEERIGMVVDPESESEIEASLEKLIIMKETNKNFDFGTGFQRDKFESMNLTKKLVELFEKCIQ